MASNDDRRPTDKDAIALLRRLRAGVGNDDVHFVVHRVDVCAAPPEFLVADLEPVPGTGLDDGGHGRIWYMYHAKKFTNKQGRLSGYRQRSVTGGGGASWHSEIAAKDVEGSGGGTVCTFSYGLKTNPSARSINRLGWCMAEYDIAAADNEQDETANNYVLCKVYRSPRAKEKLTSASASSSSKKSKTTKKRKAGGGGHPEAPPTKSIQQQEPQVQQEIAYYPMPCYQPQPQDVQEVAVQQPAGPGGDFNCTIEDINFYVDESMLRDEPVPEPGLQQPIAAEPEHDDSRFIQLPCGPVLAAEAATVGDVSVPETAVQRGAKYEHEHGDKDLNAEELFTVEWLSRGEAQQPIVEPPPAHGGEFMQMPWGPAVPVVAEAIFEDMLLGLAPEMMNGQWSGGMTTTASMPWNSNAAYAATSSSSYAASSSLLQGRRDPLRLPYLTC